MIDSFRRWCVELIDWVAALWLFSCCSWPLLDDFRPFDLSKKITKCGPTDTEVCPLDASSRSYLSSQRFFASHSIEWTVELCRPAKMWKVGRCTLQLFLGCCLTLLYRSSHGPRKKRFLRRSQTPQMPTQCRTRITIRLTTTPYLRPDVSSQRQGNHKALSLVTSRKKSLRNLQIELNGRRQ